MTEDVRGDLRDSAVQMNRTEEAYDPGISLGPLFRALWSYRGIMVLSGSGIIVACFLGALWVYESQEIERRASLEFRVMFDGATDGEYPNGLPFSRDDIVGDPVLTEVFERNDLGRYAAFDDFARGIFVLDTNSEVALLGLEYQAKLSEPSLTAVDRTVLEAEFRDRRAALLGAHYSLNFVTPGDESLVPDLMMGKVLNDILTVWAEQASTNKGVFLYQLEHSIPELVSLDLSESIDYGLRTDSLRGTLNRLIEFLGEVEQLPGASTFRTQKQPSVSPSDIRVTLEDILRYRLDPTAQAIWSTGLSTNLEFLTAYLRGRQLELELDRDAAAGIVTLLEESMRDYFNGFGWSAGARAIPGDTALSPSQSSAGVFAPRVGDSNLDSLLAMAAMAGGGPDAEFRQNLTDRIIEAGEAMVEIERESAYYSRLAGLMPAGDSGLNLTGSPVMGMNRVEATRVVEAELEAVANAVREAVGQANRFLVELAAQNLQPQTNVFSITSQFTATDLRPVTVRIFFVYGLVALVLAFVVLPVSCMTHFYFRREILLEAER